MKDNLWERGRGGGLAKSEMYEERMGGGEGGKNSV